MAPGGQEFDSVVRLVGVQKYFGAVHALRDIDIAIGRNEIVGLIGDNGAGKSTLIKVMTGVLAPSAGKIYIRDREIPQSEYSVRMAHDLSIETVYQDKSLADKQPLWRNFFVGRQIANRFGFIDIKREKEVAQRILIDVIGFRGLGITVDSTVANLSGGERQGIAIGRAMHYNADLIVLDEPTAALGVKESRRVLELILDVKKRGLPIILISHNMPHVFEVADRIHIHRLGRRLAVIDPKKQTMSDAVAMRTVKAATRAAMHAARAGTLPVLAWALPDTVADLLRQETGEAFEGQPPGRIDLCIRVDRARQRRAALMHASQISPAAVLWRRLQLQGDCEHLRWLLPPGGRSPAQWRPA